MASRLRSYFSLRFSERRSFGIVFFFLGLLALSRVVETVLVQYYTRRWESVVGEISEAQLQTVRTEITGVQRRVRRIATELARHEDVTAHLLGTPNDLSLLFARVDRIARKQDVGVEVYDRHGTLIAWQGRSGFVEPREIENALRGMLTSYVSRGPIYSHLFVITPVRVEGKIIGAILARQAVEVNYPLSNKFITRAGLAELLSRELGVTVEIIYGEQAKGRTDGRYVSTVLQGIDNRKLAVANVLRLSRSTFLERLSGTFQKLNAFLWLCLIVVACIYASQLLHKIPRVLWKSLAVTALIWLGRYALLWLEIPSVFFELKIFDPAHFASKFGGGIAKSVGEMTLTSLALAANTALVAFFFREPPRDEIRFPSFFKLPVSVLVTAFIFLMLRGYAAVIRSAVFDSNLRFNDPNLIVPSLELGLMVFSLFAIGFCVVAVAVALTTLIASLLRGTEDTASTKLIPWLVVAGLFVVAAILFDVLQETPLMSTPFRLTFGACILALSLYVYFRRRKRIPPISFFHAVIVLALSVVFFYPLLDEVIREKDRETVAVFAREALRPADAWLKFIVNEALRSFVSDESFDVLLNGSREELERLAFTCWARSTAAQRGYNCSFTFFSPGGEELSRFAIGEQPQEFPRVFSAAVRNGENQVAVHEVGSALQSVKIYFGSMPVIANDQLLGYAAVAVSAARQPLFRGEAPSVFRTTPEENLEYFYRTIMISEFREGRLTSADMFLPLGYKIPAAVQERFRDSLTTSVWHTERIGEKKFETYFVRPEPGIETIVALRMEQPQISSLLFGVVRLVVYYAIVLLVAVILVLAIQWLRGNPYQFTFRDKLLVVLLIVAILPVIVITAFTRSFARERLMENLSRRLTLETTAIENSIAHDLNSDTTAAGTDFNYYVERNLKISSRPELYDTGILDRRLSGAAYFNIFERGTPFHLETENIGLYRYAVGYRPVLDAQRRITGVIAVPTLYRQEQIDEEVSRTNAVVFGVAALVVLMIALIATTFANRIASPLHKLTEAMKRVAMGDLDVRVKARADGEIGELIRSFESMTRDLKRSREHLVQFERELAWKEMAKQVAHEIKNPLTPMKLALQHLRQTYRDRIENFDEVFEEVSQMVIRQVDTLSRIASEFSSFARMPKARMEKTSINDVLREAIDLFEQDRKVHFRVILETHLPPIMADREELRRAFINLLRNGIQAMNGEGNMNVTSTVTDEHIEIRIQDFGCGIPDEIKGKLFQPNFSTKTDGMGLGLAIVKKTVEDLNGTIALESKLNEGTTVVIHIPHKGHVL